MGIGRGGQAVVVWSTVKGQSTPHNLSPRSLVFSNVATGANEGEGVRGTDQDCRRSRYSGVVVLDATMIHVRLGDPHKENGILKLW